MPLYVYVAIDESGNNVFGELRLTRNRLRSVWLSPGWSKIFKVPCQQPTRNFPVHPCSSLNNSYLVCPMHRGNGTRCCSGYSLSPKHAQRGVQASMRLIEEVGCDLGRVVTRNLHPLHPSACM